MDAYQASLQAAKLLFANHWLSHARCKCQEALNAAGDGQNEAEYLLKEIDNQLQVPSGFDLSQEHAPLIVLLNQKCIISTLHFRYLNDAHMKREAFRQAVNYIDIETSSRCNRKCLYCPNSQNDRLSFNEFMEESVYTSFINDLYAIDYDRELHFVGYSEPLLYVDDLLRRVALARKMLPKAHLIAFTNGDYLEPETVEQLIFAGCSEIKISVHLPPGKPYKDESIFTRINKIATRLNTPIIPQSYVKDTHIAARLVHEGILIQIYQTDYERLGSNRAATLKGIGPKIDTRTSACLMPICQFIVGYKGAVVPCCVMVSDDPRNSKYLVGHIGRASGRTNSIFDIYSGNMFVEWRRDLFNLAPKAAPAISARGTSRLLC